jgi:hypothetical protein
MPDWLTVKLIRHLAFHNPLAVMDSDPDRVREIGYGLPGVDIVDWRVQLFLVLETYIGHN